VKFASTGSNFDLANQVILKRSSAPTSKRDLAKIQEQFNAWVKRDLPALIGACRSSAPFQSARIMRATGMGGDVIASHD
jgi:hypothetical protein